MIYLGIILSVVSVCIAVAALFFLKAIEEKEDNLLDTCEHVNRNIPHAGNVKNLIRATSLKSDAKSFSIDIMEEYGSHIDTLCEDIKKRLGKE